MCTQKTKWAYGLCLWFSVSSAIWADDVGDERAVVLFDGRQWKVAHAQASELEIAVDYILETEDRVEWTEKLKTVSIPVKPVTGLTESIRDFYLKDLRASCAGAQWSEVSNTDNISISEWNIEVCSSSTPLYYGLVVIRPGSRAMHILEYTCRARDVFNKNHLNLRKSLAGPLVFAPTQTSSIAQQDYLRNSAKMIRIVYRLDFDTVSSNSFVELPRTLWRSGSKFMRYEETPDSSQRVHILSIASSPDAWIMNLFDNLGRHVVDKGPTYNTIFPIFGEMRKDGLRELEFGKEQAFFAHYGARKLSDDVLNSVDCEVYELPRLSWVLHIHVRKDTGMPYRIQRRAADGTVSAVWYDEYQTELVLDSSLFVPPPTVHMREG